MLVDERQTPSATPTLEPKMRAGAFVGSIVRVFPAERIIQVLVEDVSHSAPEVPAKTEAGAPNEDAGGAGTLRPGHTIFVDVTSCLRVADHEGAEKKRDNKTSWFNNAEGWEMLKVHQRVEIDHSGSSDVARPTMLDGEFRTEHFTVCNATLLHISMEEAPTPEVRTETESTPETPPKSEEKVGLSKNEGEGSTSAARDYLKGVEEYVKTHDPQAVAEEAARDLGDDDTGQLRSFSPGGS